MEEREKFYLKSKKRNRRFDYTYVYTLDSTRPDLRFRTGKRFEKKKEKCMCYGEGRELRTS